MTTQKKSLGQRGEQMALAHLQQQGYTILAANWRCPSGELDIVAQQDNVVVFVEVRTRYTNSTEAAFESITPRKREKLASLAHLYLEAMKLEALPWRVDVIAIAVPPSGKPILEQMENALDW